MFGKILLKIKPVLFIFNRQLEILQKQRIRKKEKSQIQSDVFHQMLITKEVTFKKRERSIEALE